MPPHLIKSAARVHWHFLWNVYSVCVHLYRKEQRNYRTILVNALIAVANSWQKKLKEVRIYFGSRFEGFSIMAEKAGWQACQVLITLHQQSGSGDNAGA